MVICCDNSLSPAVVKIIPRSEVEARLSDAGLEMTPQRFAVLECLVRTDGHPTLGEIVEKLQRLYPRPSSESVQRTLQILCDSGLTCADKQIDQLTRYRLGFDPLDASPADNLEDD